jgi:alcohol dehydrogenase class IV
MRFNLAEAPEARARLEKLFDSDDPAGVMTAMLSLFPIPQRLREVGFPGDKADFVAAEIAAATIKSPRPATAANVHDILAAAY